MNGLAAKLAAIGTAVDANVFYRRVHEGIGQYGKREAADIGGTMTVWSKGRAAHRKVKLSAGYDVTTRSVQIKPRQAGLWAIREDGAKRTYDIPKVRKRGRGGAKKQAKRLAIPGSPTGFAMSARHPPIAGQQRWTKVRREVVKEAPAIVDREVVNTLRRTFGPGT